MDKEDVIWAMFYANMVSMRMHPGYKDKPNYETLNALAEAADAMLEIYKKRRQTCQ